MEQEEANRIIHEAKESCVHEPVLQYENKGFSIDTYVCEKEGCKYHHTKCDNGVPLSSFENPDYSLWIHYGPMLEWAKEQKWWWDFMTGCGFGGTEIRKYVRTVLLNPTQGSLAIASYIVENVKEGR